MVQCAWAELLFVCLLMLSLFLHLKIGTFDIFAAKNIKRASDIGMDELEYRQRLKGAFPYASSPCAHFAS